MSCCAVLCTARCRFHRPQVKKVLHTGVNRWLCKAYRFERRGYQDHRNLHSSTPAIFADRSPFAREGGCTSCGEASNRAQHTETAGSVDGEARHVASIRSRCSAQRCGQDRFVVRGRSDPCSLHHEGSCSRISGVFATSRTRSARLHIIMYDEMLTSWPHLRRIGALTIRQCVSHVYCAHISVTIYTVY